MKRSPAAAVWLSLLIPGLGHFYLGQVAKGITFALLAAGLIQVVSQGAGGFGILIAALWLFVMIDAHRSAQEVNLRIESGLPTGDAFAARGSKWWGGVLIALGVVFLLYNFGVFDLDWLWQLWPAALVAAGIWLIRPLRPASSSATPPLPSDSFAAPTPTEAPPPPESGAAEVDADREEPSSRGE